MKPSNEIIYIYNWTATSITFFIFDEHHIPAIASQDKINVK